MDISETLEHIRAVKARYCRFVDTKDWQGLRSLFADDARLDISDDVDWEVPSGGDAIVETISSTLRHARSAHHVHSPEVTMIGDGEASVIWAMQDRVLWDEGTSPLPGVTAMTGYGHYHERYVRIDGEWRIASLKLTRLIVETSR